MSSLENRLYDLESDLRRNPPAISVYRDLPFAIFRYDPGDEWMMRREYNNLARRLSQSGKDVVEISLESALWEILDSIEKEYPGEGYHSLIDLEKSSDFLNAQEVVITYLTNPDWFPLTEYIEKKLQNLDPSKHIVFLVNATAMAPDICHMSNLLDNLQGRTLIPIILFYPGTIEGATGLRFLGIRDREPTGNYRVKIY